MKRSENGLYWILDNGVKVMVWLPLYEDEPHKELGFMTDDIETISSFLVETGWNGLSYHEVESGGKPALVVYLSYRYVTKEEARVVAEEEMKYQEESEGIAADLTNAIEKEIKSRRRGGRGI